MINISWAVRPGGHRAGCPVAREIASAETDAIQLFSDHQTITASSTADGVRLRPIGTSTATIVARAQRARPSRSCNERTHAVHTIEYMRTNNKFYIYCGWIAVAIVHRCNRCLLAYVLTDF